jgi:cell division protein FtsI/penicillin-binding protein 2
MMAIACLLLAAFAGLGFRLFQLQVIDAPELKAQAERNWERRFEIPPLRGEIRDTRGEMLARSIHVSTVCADPSITSERAHEIAMQLAPLLQMDPEDLLERLTRPGKYVRLKQRVDDETVKAIKALGFRGLTYEDAFIRVYPNNTLLAHVLGWTNSEQLGIAGIELTMNKYLAGAPGRRVIETDRRGRENVTARREEIPVRDGDHVVLTIDQVIQHIVEAALDDAVEKFQPKGIVAIVMRPATGEILAMSSRPTFDPNRYNKFSDDAHRNRCISDTAEPGSVFKVVPIAGALSDGSVTLATRFDCENGGFRYGGHTLRDSHPHGVLSTLEILTVSSNIGAAKIGIVLGKQRLFEHIQNFGFGKKTGIQLPGEISGISHPPSKWSGVSIAQIPMGQGISATPIQMINAFNAIANDGVLMRPLLVKRVVSRDGRVVQEFPATAERRVVSPQAAAQMRLALKTVPLSKGQTALDGSVTNTQNGTAPKAALADWVVAGKTGTAWKVEEGKYVRKYYSSFIGFLPADKPELCILVSVDEPQQGGYYGGTVAAPVFREIAEKSGRYLNIPAIPKPARPPASRNAERHEHPEPVGAMFNRDLPLSNHREFNSLPPIHTKESML